MPPPKLNVPDRQGAHVVFPRGRYQPGSQEMSKNKMKTKISGT